MKTMAEQGKGGGGGGGGKAVEPVAPRQGFLTWITKAPEFFAQVRQEALKVTWPTLAETRLTTIAVFIMILMSIVFFFAVDYVLSTAVKLVLGLV
jgi:preprotein translocase subunit SecE